MNRAVSTKLICVSDPEAIQIGKNLIPSLKSKKLVEAGVDVWKLQNKAIKELMEKHDWFLPMIVIMSKGIVKTAAWGLLWRVTIGGALSLGDLATDILVLLQFWNGGDKMSTFKDLSLISLSASILLQLMVVTFQNRKKKISKLLKEWAIVLIGMKGPWDAYRVAIGAEQEKDTEFDPIMEMSFSKGIEIFAESIPAILIQSSAILSALESGESISRTAYISLLVSMFSTGFVSATISYDTDTNPEKRAGSPQFYGLVPDNGTRRALLFVSMTTMSSCLVMMKSLLLVSLGKIKLVYCFAYFFGEVAIYLVMKIVRGDFTYWLPLEGCLKILMSILMRVAVQIIAAFTGTNAGVSRMDLLRAKRASRNAKIQPLGGTGSSLVGGLDQEEFKREMSRRGSLF
ncbi:hypothetical protein TrVE_jg2396 [Triparma verrucosa]|uniref:Uncharacterized protein n=1 Tax=Triparma verrucosa TaxID=1606542 RepID=A0A9W6ZEB4_9STRA|nr:hypothetical protein TrVE_jg2396 [Triparma verrucosa]